MVYGWNDVWQAALGTFIGVFFLYLLRSGEPISIDPKIGLGIGLFWLYLTGKPFLKRGWESKKHWIGNIITATCVSIAMSVAFKLMSFEQVWNFGFFGTAGWLGMLWGIDSAQFFDRFNITNMYDRWYVRK